MYSKNNNSQIQSSFKDDYFEPKYYDEKTRKKQKIKELVLPIMLFVIISACEIFFIYNTFMDYYYMYTGVCVQAKIDDDFQDTIRIKPDIENLPAAPEYISSEGPAVYIALSEKENGYVKVYYKGDWWNVRTVMYVGVYVVMHVIFLSLIALLIFWIRKLVKEKDVFTMIE